MCAFVCAAKGRPVLHPKSCSSLSLCLSPSLKKVYGSQSAALARATRLTQRVWHQPVRALSFLNKCMHTLWFTGLRAGRAGRTRPGLLSIQLLIASVYELLQFNWTELKVLGFHLLNKSWCVISVMGLDSSPCVKFERLFRKIHPFACELSQLRR